MTPLQNNNTDDSTTHKKVPYHFGEKLRQVREHKGYTLKVVAQQAGVSESLVSQIERNHVSPAIDTLLALADVLDINLEFLFEEYRKEIPLNLIWYAFLPTPIPTAVLTDTSVRKWATFFTEKQSLPTKARNTFWKRATAPLSLLEFPTLLKT